MSSLAIRNVRKAYGLVEVLHDIDIEISDGEFLVLVGPSGCGKSTLLNMVAGLEDITGGTLAIDGTVVNGLDPKDRDIAMVFQSYALYPTMDVATNIAFGLEMRGVPKAERARKVEEVASLLQIEPLLKRKPGQLSGGQRQRVAMGRALVRDPKIFLFDEPLSNLDAKLRVEMRTEIKKLHQRLGTTIVYVTHDQIEAMTMATRIAVMNKGYLQQLGTPREIYNFPANTFVATFMGSPPMNLIPGRVGRGAKGAIIEIGSEPIAIPEHVDHEAMTPGREILVGLRSEWLSADPPGGPSWQLEEQILVVEPTGPNTMALLHLAGTEVTAALSGDADVRPGDHIRLHADLGRALVFDAKTGSGLHRRVPTTPISERHARRSNPAEADAESMS